MTLIPLRARDGSLRAFTKVDEADAPWTNQWRWSWSVRGYAVRGFRVDGRSRTVTLHRELLGLTDPTTEVDHINRDPLDNRRANLRVVTHAQNMQNRNKDWNAQWSRHRGVTYSQKDRLWVAQLVVNGKRVYTGWFRTEHEAAIAARDARLQHAPFSTEASK